MAAVVTKAYFSGSIDKGQTACVSREGECGQRAGYPGERFGDSENGDNMILTDLYTSVTVDRSVHQCDWGGGGVAAGYTYTKPNKSKSIVLRKWKFQVHA